MKTSTTVFVGSLTLFSAAPALAGLVYEGESGTLTFGGDVELDINAHNTQSGPIFFTDEVDSQDEYYQDGRILLDVSGERTSTTGNYARFKAQPLIKTDGDPGIDDAWFAFGSRDGLEVRIGRFEAFDLFPLGQDTVYSYSGSTSDGLYTDGQGYVYQAKEGRGRAASAGQVMLSQRSGDFYAELSTLFGDRTDLFDGAGDGGTYHGYDIDPDAKNSFIVRPVLAWSPGPWTLAAGMETNLVNDALVDERGEDISDRTGYGTRLSYAAGDWSINANLAYLDAHEEDNLTLGLNAVWRNLGVGYIHARNEIDDVKPGSNGDFELSVPGKYTVDTLYTSYRFPDVLNVENFDVYLGAYYSQIDHKEIDNLDDADRYGGRLRFKYHF
ncbi:carbohydrate porin [Halomonas sp. BM-2019]|uniref:carbohydrate porin n=1 Tax=Halomonas sp. BM-2019 TaxID=2811227 RepID=UPI001B3C4573|nr:MAG: carbohydrate porin [Halomonas sp. BM-2019]